MIEFLIYLVTYVKIAISAENLRQVYLNIGSFETGRPQDNRLTRCKFKIQSLQKNLNGKKKDFKSKRVENIEPISDISSFLPPTFNSSTGFISDLIFFMLYKKKYIPRYFYCYLIMFYKVYDVLYRREFSVHLQRGKITT